MIYLGVDLFQYDIGILALSQDYTPIEKRNFNFARLENIEQWVESITDIYDKKVKWFFDDKQFKKRNIALDKLSSPYYKFYLVDHRQLLKKLKFVYDYMFHIEYIKSMDITFFLASADRIIDVRFIKVYNPIVDDLPF